MLSDLEGEHYPYGPSSQMWQQTIATTKQENGTEAEIKMNKEERRREGSRKFTAHSLSSKS